MIDDEYEPGTEPGGEPEPSPESVDASALSGALVGERGPEEPLPETMPDDSQPVGETVLDDPMPSLPDLGIPEDTWDPAARESDEEPGHLAPCAVCDKVGPHECVVDPGPSRAEVENDLSAMRDDLLGKIKRLRLGPANRKKHIKQGFTTNLVTVVLNSISCHDTNTGSFFGALGLGSLVVPVAPQVLSSRSQERQVQAWRLGSSPPTIQYFPLPGEGLIDFIKTVLSPPSSSSSSSFSSVLLHPSPLLPRPPCRTSTASSRAEWTAPDLHCQLTMAVCSAGHLPQAPAWSGQCWTSTAGGPDRSEQCLTSTGRSCAVTAVLDFNCQKESMNMCHGECQNVCQITSQM